MDCNSKSDVQFRSGHDWSQEVLNSCYSRGKVLRRFWNACRIPVYGLYSLTEFEIVKETTLGCTMKRILTFVLALTLCCGLFSTLYAQNPEIDAKRAQIDSLRTLMEELPPGSEDEYNRLMTEFTALNDEVRQMIESIQADNAARQQAINQFNDGNRALRSRRYAEAIQSFRSAVQNDPLLYQAYYQLGIAYQQNNDFDNALEAFTQAGAIRSDYIRAFTARGNLLIRMGRFDEAITAFRTGNEITSATPDDRSKNLEGMGRAYMRMRNYEQAVSAFQMAVQVDPNNASAYYNMGRTFKEQRDNDSAREALESAATIEGGNHRYHTELASVLNLLGRYSAAAQAARAAIGINNNYAAAWFELGWALQNNGEDAEAITAYERAMRDRNFQEAADYQIKLIRGEF